MKKAISISICTLILSLLAVRIVQISNDDIIKFGNLEKSYAVTFSIPDNNTICDPDTLFAILSRTAQDSKSNIIRTSITDGKNRKSYVFNKYVLLADTDSNYCREFGINTGRFLTEKETLERDSGRYCRSRGECQQCWCTDQKPDNIYSGVKGTFFRKRYTGRSVYC